MQPVRRAEPAGRDVHPRPGLPLPGQRCYVDGCGTLPDDLLAEVITTAPTGVTSVDLPMGPAQANLPLVLPDVQLLQLTIRRGPGAIQAACSSSPRARARSSPG